VGIVQHFYKDIVGWGAFIPLYEQMVQKFGDGARFVEVGSWLGKSAAFMAVEIENSGKQIEFVCVDPWLDGGPDLRDTKHFKELGVSQVYDTFLRNVRPVMHRIKAMRMSSVEAAKYMADDSVHFLMLDGDHSYEAVKADIEAWLPKMKPGGIISGDDYTWPGVERAVGEAFGRMVRTVVNGAQGGRRKADYRKDASYWWVPL
jgi:predicted O-methyltransferase YrrM